MQRSVRTGLASLLLAAFCATPAGAHSIQFLWQATGTDSISVLPGDEVVLEIWVESTGPGIALASVSALATPGLLTATDWSVCSTPCTPDGVTFLDGPLGPLNVVLNDQNDGNISFSALPGLSGSFAAALLPIPDSIATGSFRLAEITYVVGGVGVGEVVPFYRGGIDGVMEAGTNFLIPLSDGADLTSGVSFQVVPEPGTAALLSLGLGGFALRRRSGGSC